MLSPLARLSAFAALGTALLSAAPASAAGKQLRLVVPSNGNLRVTGAALKNLGVKPASDGLVCVEFPSPPRIKRPHLKEGDVHFEHEVANAPVRFWLPPAKDGTVTVARTFLGAQRGFVPAGPGTVYLATVQKGRLVLSKAPAKSRQ